MKQVLLTVALFVSSGIGAYPVTPEDNIVIIDGAESYEFVVSDKGIVVKTVQTHEFEASRRAETVSSQIFYSGNITLDKASGKGKAQYKRASAEGIFHDDSRICCFNTYLDAKGKRTRTEFRRTFTDPAFFTKIMLSDIYPISRKEVTVAIPASLSRIRLIELNLPENITRTDSESQDGSRIVRYSIADLDGISDNDNRPGPLLSEPCVIICGWFADTDKLYEWEREISRVDVSIPDIENLMSKVTMAETESQRIADTFAWVQSNIRYIAYEEGDAGHRPDAPAEVLRKRYGDCKGMALLLTTLLRHQGFDAHIASVGTRNIPFNIAEIPSLAAEDHMICVLNPDSHSPMFLDPTAKHIPHTHIPYSIQGKDALIYKGDTYGMLNVPMLEPQKSVDRLEYNYIISDSSLVGDVRRTFTGDAKEWFMRSLGSLKQDRHTEAVALMLVPNTRAGVAPESTALRSENPESVSITGKVRNSQGYTETDTHIYIDLNTSGDPMSGQVETYKRRHDYLLPYPAVVSRVSTLLIPEGYDVTYLPESFRTTTPQGTLSCSFTRAGDTVVMSKEMIVSEPRVRLTDIDTWNNALIRWNEACNQQVELIANNR